MANIRRTECGRCGAEVREGKRTHYCGYPHPNKVTDDIRVVEYVPASHLAGAVDALDDLLDWAENMEGEGRLRRTEALSRARYALATARGR